jgi:hypothetical protein
MFFTPLRSKIYYAHVAILEHSMLITFFAPADAQKRDKIPVPQPIFNSILFKLPMSNTTLSLNNYGLFYIAFL